MPTARDCPLHHRVVLSSPGDVADERRLAQDVLRKLPQRYPFKGKVTIEVEAWDDEASPVPMSAKVPPQDSVVRYKTLPWRFLVFHPVPRGAPRQS